MPPRKKVEATDGLVSAVPLTQAEARYKAGKDQLDKVFKTDSPEVKIDYDALRKPRPHFPSGSIILDYLLGGKPNKFGVAPCPGWPRGVISNVYGHESSGKTTIALVAAAQVCKSGGTVVYIDWEHALDLVYAESLGVPVRDKSRFTLYQPNTLEDGLKIIHVMASYGTDLIVLDSVGSAVPKRVFEQSVEEQGDAGRVGALAQMWSIFLPKLANIVHKTGTHIMGISQMRAKINTGPAAGAAGEGLAPQGGNAWKFYTHVRMKLQKVFSEKGNVYNAVMHKKEEQVLAIEVEAKMDKSKISASMQHKAKFWITFGAGVDDLRSVIETCANHGVIKKAGAGWFTWERSPNEIIKVQGISALKERILATPGAVEELTNAARQKIIEAHASIDGGVEMDVDDEDEDIDLDTLMATTELKVNSAYAAELEEASVD